LVDDGINPHDLEGLCQRLRAQGFSSVHVLSGGLGAWALVGPIRGAKNWESQLMAVKPAEAFSARSSRRWIVAGVGIDSDQLESSFPWARAIQCEDESSLLSAVRRMGSDSADSHRSGVLLVSADGYGYPKPPDLSQIRRLLPVFSVEGGLSAYRAFIEQHRRLVARVKAKPEVVPRCAQ
jgi:hypothetical protein